MLAGDFTDVCSWMTTLDDNFGRNLTKDVQEKMVIAWKLLTHEKGGGRVLPEKLGKGVVFTPIQTKICDVLPPFSYVNQNLKPDFRHGASKKNITFLPNVHNLYSVI